MSAPLHHPRSPSSLPVPAPVSFPTSLSKACCDLLTPLTADLGTCGASEATCERSWLGSHSWVRWRRQRWETGSKCGAISETENCPIVYCYCVINLAHTILRAPVQDRQGDTIMNHDQSCNIPSENAQISWVPCLFKDCSRHWTPCILNTGKCEHKDFNFSGSGNFSLGVWQRHTAPKNWRLAAAPFTIQLLSKLPCQLWDKQKLDSRLQMPQNRKYSRQQRKKCWHPLNGPYQILGQEASMLPDQHLPAMCMGASHAPSTSWRMCEVVYNNCLFFTGCYRTLLARDAKQPNHWKEKIDTFWPHVAPTSKYKWLV